MKQKTGFTYCFGSDPLASRCFIYATVNHLLQKLGRTRWTVAFGKFGVPGSTRAIWARFHEHCRPQHPPAERHRGILAGVATEVLFGIITFLAFLPKKLGTPFCQKFPCVVESATSHTV